jgi:hypothetical protein
MRLIRITTTALALGCLIATPAFAGQRGAHTPPPHPATPATPPPHSIAPGHSTTSPHNATTVGAQVTANPALATRLQPLLPAGMTLEAAADGFKNQGQFIAALHVSHNLGISFESLKTAMTGPNHDSLGQAIHALKPSADADSSTKTAEQEADNDLKTSRTGSTTGKNKAQQ